MKTNNIYKSVFGRVLPLAVGLCLTAAAAAQTSEIRQDLEEVQVDFGDTFETVVIMDASSEPISVIDVHLNFDPAYLEVESIEVVDDGLFNYHQAPTFDNAIGNIDLAGFRFGNDVLNGNYEVIKVTFRALGATEFTQITHEMNNFPQTLLAYAGENRLGNVTSTTVVISEGQVSGVDDHSAVNGEVSLWPNPATNVSQMKFIPALSGNATIDLYDPQGKIVKSIFAGSLIEGKTYQYEIDVQGLASGMYNCALRIGEFANNQQLVVIK